MLAPLRIGADFGREHDPTAFCIVQVNARGDFDVRQLKRVPIGTPYGEVVQMLVHAVEALRIHGAVTVYVDATGAGSIVDELVKPLRGLALLRPVEIAAGIEVKDVVKATGDHYIRIGKPYLIGRLKALLQTGRVKSAKTPEWDALSQELLKFEVAANKQADRYAARAGFHDDLVISLALALIDDLLVPTSVGSLVAANEGLADRGAYSPVASELGHGGVGLIGGSFLTRW